MSNESSAANVEPRQRPSIRNVEDFWCWLNTWGNLDDYQARARPDWLSIAWREGYEKAVSDAMKALEEAGVGFEQVSDEAWARWTGHA